MSSLLSPPSVINAQQPSDAFLPRSAPAATGRDQSECPGPTDHGRPSRPGCPGPTGPTVQADQGLPGLTTADRAAPGRPRPTTAHRAHHGRPGSARADHSRPGPSRADWGRPGPTGSDRGRPRAPTGQATVTAWAKGARWRPMWAASTSVYSA